MLLLEPDFLGQPRPSTSTPPHPPVAKTIGERDDLLLLRAFVATAGTRLMLAAFSLATGVLTARVLGPEGRGQYFLGVTLMTLGAQLATLGFHSSNTYQLSRREDALRGLVANSFWYSAGAGAVLAAVLGSLLAAGFFPALEGGLGAVALIGVAPALFTILASGLLAGLGRFDTLNRCDLLSRGVLLLVMVALASRADPLVFLSATVGGFVLGAAL